MLIDVSHLVVQTAGDEALQREILALFEGQMRDVARNLQCLADVDPASLLLVLHRSRGAALAIGAFGLGEELALVEAKLASGTSILALTDEIGALRERIVEAAEHASSLIAARPHGGLAKAAESG
ncbi:hypothetical protein [Lichenifustis flavocetrariae]|uniref:HPt domain-containing protein n=1 Tax=Lichenifustis flavocetrariae TaxID=2949735 RepID=A0AA41YSF3_9HYPH|nr:hypothetical protein [Lichenifustis flavocetrariae]MCW6506465.1 hypothetical protein [Lichenifustis flavocetrariae]